ncbi:GNAT family N-acetyltransferase [Ktedonobacter robiniae]|uniref:N-acetyltransferase domain-containing protein n=1 Tax=Ktedonobacter robiniae TaxID=2778365 RepID=A0ABQ3V5G3_9CHLR|nr:GNAT family protein [Ktedonobacter robiniae]GHO60153.1 hypothetical protein KSB_86280 [Ktedonobacter robiniae]
MNLLGNNLTLIPADREGRLIGVAETAFHPSANVGWIALLIIRREFQGRGYGREAATLLKDYLFSSPEVTEIGLGVLVQNTLAQAFWESCGYARNARHRDTHGNGCYMYRFLRTTVVT